MTFKEKLMQENPEKKTISGEGCPDQYGYERERSGSWCDGRTCAECWNREIPEPQESAVTAIQGVSPDEPIVTGESGGKQARSLYAFHLCDTETMLSLARVMQEGAHKYDRDNWRKIPAEEHFNHLIIHWYAYLMGDRSDDHLGHMFARAMMCAATAREEAKQHDQR